jgi:hypothetical protein
MGNNVNSWALLDQWLMPLKLAKLRPAVKNAIEQAAP